MARGKVPKTEQGLKRAINQVTDREVDKVADRCCVVKTRSTGRQVTVQAAVAGTSTVFSRQYAAEPHLA